MFRTNRFLAVTLGIWSAGSLLAQGPSSSSLVNQPILLRECPVLPIDDIRVAVQVQGILDEINVTEGDPVEVGQVLAKIKDDMARIEYEAQKIAAENTAPEREALAKLEEAEASRENTARLQKTGAESTENLRKEEAKVKVATAMYDNAKVDSVLNLNRKLLKMEELLHHQVMSPIRGRVEEVIVNRGQAVEALTPVIRVVNTERVKLKGSIDLLNADRVEPGMYLEVYPDITEGPVISMPGHTAAISAVAMLADNERCLSASVDGMIIEWNLRQRSQLRVFRDHEYAVTAIAIRPKHPDQFLSADSRGNLYLWDLAQGTVTKRIDTKGGGIDAIVLHPVDPDVVIASHRDHEIRLWNLKSGDSQGSLRGHTSDIRTLAVTPDGATLISTDDQTLRLWDLKSGKQIRSEGGRSSDVASIGLSADGQQYLFNSFGTLQVRPVAGGRPEAVFQNSREVFSEVAYFVPQSGLVLAATKSEEIELWQHTEEGREPRLVRRYRGHTGPIASIDFTSDGRIFVSGGADRTVKVWSIPSMEDIHAERLAGRVKFVDQVVETSQREMLAEVDNIGNVLRPGRMATIVIYPGEPIEQMARLAAPKVDANPEPAPTEPQLLPTTP